MPAISKLSKKSFRPGFGVMCRSRIREGECYLNHPLMSLLTHVKTDKNGCCIEQKDPGDS